MTEGGNEEDKKNFKKKSTLMWHHLPTPIKMCQAKPQTSYQPMCDEDADDGRESMEGQNRQDLEDFDSELSGGHGPIIRNHQRTESEQELVENGEHDEGIVTTSGKRRINVK